MTEKETKEFLLVVQSYYQHLKIDELLIKEWYAYTKDCYKDDVYRKFREHLQGDYKDKVPFIAYLTKYLPKVSEQGKEIYIKCQLCGTAMNMKDYEKHYHRESSVDFMEKQALKYLNKQIDRQKFLGMEDDEFDEKYDRLLEAIKDKVDNVEFYGTSTKGIIEKILDAKV
jgi:uncharacterized C2H2 Zn-finger protein